MSAASTADEQSPPRARSRRRAPAVLREVLVTLAGLAGLLGVLWVIASHLFGLSFVTFATGSMSPNIPAGSLAVVRETPAAQLRVGDVATLQRSAETLPISHRILEVSAVPSNPDARDVVMQGDANPVPDREPYRVLSGKVVLWSAPGLAAAANAFASPSTLSALTVGCAALVVWTFWPRRSA